MKITRDFEPADRYVYDFGLCNYKKGWAQVDTSQDASYFGTWANAEKLAIICYCEGDVTLTQADNPQEFVDQIRKIKAWNDENGWKFFGIDGMCSDSIIKAFTDVGLADLLH